MTRWAAFAGITLAVLSLLLVLARLSQSAVTPAPVAPEDRRRLDGLDDGAGHLEAPTAPAPKRTPAEATLGPGPEPTTAALLANVAVSHGLLAALLLGGIWLADIPASALGITSAPLSTGLPEPFAGVRAERLGETRGEGVCQRDRRPDGDADRDGREAGAQRCRRDSERRRRDVGQPDAPEQERRQEAVGDGDVRQ